MIFGGGANTGITVSISVNLVLFLTGFALAMGVITWAFLEGNSTHYGEILGFLSLSVEVLCGI